MQRRKNYKQQQQQQSACVAYIPFDVSYILYIIFIIFLLQLFICFECLWLFLENIYLIFWRLSMYYANFVSTLFLTVKKYLNFLFLFPYLLDFLPFILFANFHMKTTWEMLHYFKIFDNEIDFWLKIEYYQEKGSMLKYFTCLVFQSLLESVEEYRPVKLTCLKENIDFYS